MWNALLWKRKTIRNTPVWSTKGWGTKSGILWWKERKWNFDQKSLQGGILESSEWTFLSFSFIFPLAIILIFGLLGILSNYILCLFLFLIIMLGPRLLINNSIQLTTTSPRWLSVTSRIVRSHSSRADHMYVPAIIFVLWRERKFHQITGKGKKKRFSRSLDMRSSFPLLQLPRARYRESGVDKATTTLYP